MTRITPPPRNARITATAALLALAVFANALAMGIGMPAALAQGAGAPAAATPAKGSIEKLSGVWIEGPGYDITYGKSYAVCAQRCLDAPKCAMIEYYRPEKKCNLYDSVRPRKAGGSSDVGIRR